VDLSSVSWKLNLAQPSPVSLKSDTIPKYLSLLSWKPSFLMFRWMPSLLDIWFDQHLLLVSCLTMEDGQINIGCLYLVSPWKLDTSPNYIEVSLMPRGVSELTDLKSLCLDGFHSFLLIGLINICCFWQINLPSSVVLLICGTGLLFVASTIFYDSAA
jgi:hypothetical protein